MRAIRCLWNATVQKTVMRIAILLRKPYPPRNPRFQQRGLRAILRLERRAQRTGSRRQELLALHMNRRRERPTKSCGSPQTKLQFVFLPTIQLRRRRRPTSTFSVPRPTAIWAGGRGRTFDLHLENAHSAIVGKLCGQKIKVRLPRIPPPCKLASPRPPAAFASRCRLKGGTALGCER